MCSVWSPCQNYGSLWVGYPSNHLQSWLIRLRAAHPITAVGLTRCIGQGSKAINMQGVPNATRNQQVFWDDRFDQIVFGITFA
jgi:hypothetical protein